MIQTWLLQVEHCLPGIMYKFIAMLFELSKVVRPYLMTITYEIVGHRKIVATKWFVPPSKPFRLRIPLWKFPWVRSLSSPRRKLLSTNLRQNKDPFTEHWFPGLFPWLGRQLWRAFAQDNYPFFFNYYASWKILINKAFDHKEPRRARS